MSEELSVQSIINEYNNRIYPFWEYLLVCCNSCDPKPVKYKTNDGLS